MICNDCGKRRRRYLEYGRKPNKIKLCYECAAARAAAKRARLEEPLPELSAEDEAEIQAMLADYHADSYGFDVRRWYPEERFVTRKSRLQAARERKL